MASAWLSWFSLDAQQGPALSLLSAFVTGLLASRLFYGWVNRAGLQSAGFSPTVASILSTPIIAVTYFVVFYSLLAYPFSLNDIGTVLLHTLLLMAFFALILLVLPPLLVFYLRGAFRQRRTISKIFLYAATVSSLFLQGLLLHYLGQGS